MFSVGKPGGTLAVAGMSVVDVTSGIRMAVSIVFVSYFCRAPN